MQMANNYGTLVRVISRHLCHLTCAGLSSNKWKW